MTTRDEAEQTRVGRTETWIRLGYCFLVFGGLAGAVGLLWWVCMNF